MVVSTEACPYTARGERRLPGDVYPCTAKRRLVAWRVRALTGPCGAGEAASICCHCRIMLIPFLDDVGVVEVM